MIKGIFLSTLFFILTSTTQAEFISHEQEKMVSEALSKQLHQSQEWLNLLHYKKSLIFGYVSEADGKNFFLANDGKSNPKEELIASLKAISRNTEEAPDIHPQCRFPARTRFFKRNLKSYSYFFEKECPMYSDFIKKLDAKSVSLVFSSYYLNNPSSAFGHTLMRFRKNESSKDGKTFELLDNAINYSATVTTQNALVYAALGITGGFDGEFALMPYFYKVREYNDFESRDLWDYELNLTEEELGNLIAHVFEMRQTKFDYFYFTENCSYHMLGLLDAANPTWNLTKRNPYFVIPVDTIRMVTETPGLLKRVSFRPSKLRIVKERLKVLDKKEYQQFQTLSKSMEPKDLSQNLSDQGKAKVLDALIDFIDFKHAEDVLMTNKEASKWKRKFLIARSKVDIKSKEVEIPMPEDERPDRGHKSRRVSLGYSRDGNKNNILHLEYRFALHDLVELPIGQNKTATMEMGHLKLTYFPKKQSRGGASHLDIDSFSLANITSLSPMEKYFSTISWKVNLGYKRLYDRQCFDCSTPFLQVGGGFSLKFNNLLFYGFAKTEAEISSDFKRRGYRFGVGPDMALLYRFSDNLSLNIEGDYLKKYAKQNTWIYSYYSNIHWQYFTNQSLQLNYKRYDSKWQTGLKWSHYF